MSHHRHEVGLIRRELLQLGFSAFVGCQWSSARGQALPENPPSLPKAPGFGRAKSMIVVFQTGAPSHLDTFDLKPNAPDGIRSEFQPIDTEVPGLTICEHLPQLAARMGRLAVIRSMSHPDNNHLNATHRLLTGKAQPGAFFDKVASRDDVPHYASVLDSLRPRNDGIPSGVLLPTFLMEGPLTWPGQTAGYLGAKHDPWQIRSDPNNRRFSVEELSLPVGFTVDRLTQRQGLLDTLGREIDQFSARFEQGADLFRRQRSAAFQLLQARRLAEAFELHRERESVRDRYGRHMFGQSLLLARRLVEAGVPIVQVNLGRVQNWDSHGDIFRRLRQDLLPPFDKGVTTLLDDLQARGMLDETLVLISGEFGRTPRIGVSGGATVPGRDHWSAVFTSVLAGAGIQGGQTIGASDRIGAYPATRGFSPEDLSATIYHALGLEPETEIHDRLSRPFRISGGRPIEVLWTGRTV